MKLQTLIATDMNGRVLFDVDLVSGKRQRNTPRRLKKRLLQHPGVVTVARITTIECSEKEAIKP